MTRFSQLEIGGKDGPSSAGGCSSIGNQPSGIVTTANGNGETRTRKEATAGIRGQSHVALHLVLSPRPVRGERVRVRGLPLHARLNSPHAIALSGIPSHSSPLFDAIFGAAKMSRPCNSVTLPKKLFK